MDKKKDDDKKKDEKKRSGKAVIDLNPTTDDDPTVSEVNLTPMQRRKRSISMKRHQKKVQIGRRRFKRRNPDMKRIQMRARRQAIRDTRKQFTGKQKYSNMSALAKSNVDKKVKKRASIVGRRTIKLKPQVKRRAFEQYIPPIRPNKRHHKLLDVDGDKKVKHDMRFRFYKKGKEKMQKEANISEVSLEMIKKIKARVPGVPVDVLNLINKELDNPIEKRAVANLWKLDHGVGDTAPKGKTLGYYAMMISRTFETIETRDLVKKYRRIFNESVNEQFQNIIDK